MNAGFSITPGHHLNQWLESDAMSGPGGSGSPTWTEADGLVNAQMAGGDSPQFGARWRKAQTAEAAFWRTWRENVLYKHISLSEFWQDVLDKTGGNLPDGRVLDVGCGPVSVLNFHRAQDMLPIGLDPLAALYAAEGLVEAGPGMEAMPMIALPAEQLPFVDAALDHLICFNVLDHVSDAPAVITEMRRVLKTGGTIRIYVHTFAAWIKRFLFFDRPHTYHWDHEEFKTLLTQAGFEVLHELWEPKEFDLPAGLLGKITHFPYWVATKVAATSYFQIRKL